MEEKRKIVKLKQEEKQTFLKWKYLNLFEMSINRKENKEFLFKLNPRTYLHNQQYISN